MTEQERIYFKVLTKDRSDSAKIFEKPSMRGIKNSVVEKYSDQAHFIYELLQNSDDTGATEACFQLEHDRLIFSHNGTRHFSISDPDNEAVDSASGRLGDINAITSIANSNKSSASIGKFGVGFKAVFQYTNTPYIYDPSFRFKIEHFFVPVELKKDYPGRAPDDTLFVFPFDHNDRKPEEAELDISMKLSSLTLPLLFLNSLQRITYQYGDIHGEYRKSIKESYRFGDVTAELVELAQSDDDSEWQDCLWLFTRCVDNKFSISVGYFLDENGKLEKREYPAFCFFPTKEVTKLQFIIHAPFLLTDSREGIQAFAPHNRNMVNELAALAADALVCLKNISIEKDMSYIDDGIFSIIPYSEADFSDLENGARISFAPFQITIKKKFLTEALLTSYDGSFVKAENAYWASAAPLSRIFTNTQLAQITMRREAAWVYTLRGYDETRRLNHELSKYLETIVRDIYDEEKLLFSITPSFIEAQTIDWLHQFYQYMSETLNRVKKAKTLPIFLDSSGQAVSAFDKQEQAILFLPVKGMEKATGYKMLKSELLENENTREFILKVGIKAPSLRDEIYNIILPQYNDSDKEIDTLPHFMKFFRYYRECPLEEVAGYLKLLSGYAFLDSFCEGDEECYREEAGNLYFPSEHLKKYFESKPDTQFVCLTEYQEVVGKENCPQLNSFLEGLGVAADVRIYEDEHIKSTDVNLTETRLDGCKEILEVIVKNEDIEKSRILWEQLLKIIKERCTGVIKLDDLISSKFSYFPGNSRRQRVKITMGSDVKRLRTSVWLVNSKEEFVSPENVTRQTLSTIYDLQSPAAKELMDFLKIPEGAETDSSLSEDQRRKIALVDKIEAAGITDKELEDFIRQRKARQTAKSSALRENLTDEVSSVSADERDKDEDADSSISRVMQDISRRTAKPKHAASESLKAAKEEESGKEDTDDHDDYIKAPVNYSQRIEKAKQASALEIEKIAYCEELQQRALKAKKYTYDWFCALLELETLNSNENSLVSREISISFGRVERESGTTRTLILKQPSRYIPQFMEDLADIPLELHMKEQTKTVAIEVINVKSYTLRVKLKTNAEIEGIDLSRVTEARINAKNPVFLLEELRKQFLKLDYEKDYDLQENLCENIDFVFGPPGTGKTTYLARNVLIPLMRSRENLKVLVLTPTNKAADVLTACLMDSMGGDTSYNNWLVRFGTTYDEDLERNEVFRDKTFDIRQFSRNVTITTIARFPYDFFMPGESRLYLQALHWDYIVIDEASMIPLASIAYVLHKKTPRKFIIAGDPFQIEPITSVDLWKGENIYTMVQLNSFAHPKTVPHSYTVKLLTTQYRSIPAIGTVFSNFRYNGILRHNRHQDSQRKLRLENVLKVAALNIIKFPVSRYESIYRPKKLQGKSPYHIYSALFSFEFVIYLASSLSKVSDEKFSIGIIAPYRAQADLIDRLLLSEQFPANVSVQAGTIHGFQGDECDIIIAVFNPPTAISTSSGVFLNNPNIINVSISRARDYLFIIMPDDNTENINDLHLVKQVEALMKKSGQYIEHHSHDLEETMFKARDYLEQNSFSTSHQNVNIYGLPEKCYEIRSEDNAVDIQVYKK